MQGVVGPKMEASKETKKTHRSTARNYLVALTQFFDQRFELLVLNYLLL